MKKTGILLFAMAGLLITSCSSGEENEANNEVEAVTYNLDADASEIIWRGQKNVDDGHDGTLKFSEGTLTMKGNELIEGSFVVDMSTITVTDLKELNKAESLARHLKGLDDNEYHRPEDFFNTTVYPVVTVTLLDYTDGKLAITLDILGKELAQTVDVDIINNDASANIKGDFKLDLSSLDIPGFQPDPESGEGISPELAFKLAIKLKK